MSDKRKDPVAPDGGQRRKRAAPTIDLKATEVSAPETESANAETAGTNALHDESSPHAANNEPSGVKEKSASANRNSEQTDSSPHAVGVGMPVLAVGLFGAAALVVAIVLWLSGILPPRGTSVSDMYAQMAALKTQVEELQSRPLARTMPDTGTLDALAKRVGAIENAIANLPKSDSAVAQRLSAAENAMKSLGVALAALNKRTDGIAGDVSRASTQADAAERAVIQLRDSVQNAAKEASAAVEPAQLNSLQQRIGTLEQSVKAARAEIDKIAVAEKSARLALSTNALRAAVMSGAPFQVELAQAISLGADNKMLAPLEPFATSGVPSQATLAQELHALIPAVQKAVGAQERAGGFLDRLQANARNLVRIRPVNAPASDNPSDVLTRLEFAAAHADMTAALAELNKLPDTARAPAQAWMKKAQARQAALAAAQSLADTAARNLGPE